MSQAANDNDQATLPALEEPQREASHERVREAAPEPQIVHEVGERRFERRLAHSPEKVWRALTEEEHLAHWFPAQVEGAPEVGGELRFRERDGDRPEQQGVVTECDPPRRLTYTWGEDTLSWELSPIPGGCLLVFTTTSGGAKQALPSSTRPFEANARLVA